MRCFYWELLLGSCFFLIKGFLFSSGLFHREVTYASDIQPIVSENCTQSGCHNVPGDSKFSLVTYNDVISNGRVIGGDARRSTFYNVISNHGGKAPMPPLPYFILTTDQIKLVYIWIEQSAKNNCSYEKYICSLFCYYPY